MQPAVINRKTLFWTGEHWINFLRRPGEEAHSGMVSLYHTHYSAAGAGIVGAGPRGCAAAVHGHLYR